MCFCSACLELKALLKTGILPPLVWYLPTLYGFSGAHYEYDAEAIHWSCDTVCQVIWQLQQKL